jgi:hypothetical protein
MSEASLILQLANRARTFHVNTGISQSQMARAIGMDVGNYSAFLAGFYNRRADSHADAPAGLIDGFTEVPQSLDSRGSAHASSLKSIWLMLAIFASLLARLVRPGATIVALSGALHRAA